VRSAGDHWRAVYAERQPDRLTWYEPVPETSLRMINGVGLASDAAIVDIGAGTSRLADQLLRAGYLDVTVVDVAANALALARAELAARAEQVSWLVADVRDHDFGRQFDLWHDRAVLHFMVEAADRDSYLETLRRSLRPGGHAILATFGPDGPTRCSGLPVIRYGATDLQALLAPGFCLVRSEVIQHLTPAGREQPFVYAHLRRDEHHGSI
jgi:SAM-dependent methyltransferase